jgi:hypothetical protein
MPKTVARQSRELASLRDDIDWSARKPITGADNPNFSGGKYVDDKGYVRVLRPEHPNDICGYVYEHRLVMEIFLDRYLHSWETVHHINEDKWDNRVNNLFLCTPQEHTAIHSEGRRLTWKHRDKLRETAHKTAEKRRGGKIVKRELRGKYVVVPTEASLVVYDGLSADMEVI